MLLIDPKNQNKFITSSTGQAEAITAAVEKHMLAGLYAPDDLIQKAVIKKLVMRHLPFYRFSGSYVAEWAATFGYDREEHYTVREEVYRNGVRHHELVTKTKIVTDWRPTTGFVGGNFSGLLGYAGHELGGTDAPPPKELIEILEQGSNNNLIWSSPSQTEVCIVDPFIDSADQAYEKRVENKVSNLIWPKVKENAKGDHQEGWSFKSKTSYEHKTLFIPVAQVVLEYKSKSYTIWLDGSDLSKILHGKLPEDSKKKNSVRLGLVPFVATLLAIVGLYWERGHYDWSWLSATALSTSFGYWLLRRELILDYSKKRKQTFLGHAKATGVQASKSFIEDAADIPRGVQAGVQDVKKPFLANGAYDPFVLTLISAFSIFLATTHVSSFSGVDWETALAAEEAQMSHQQSAAQPDAESSDPARTPNTNASIKQSPPKFKDYPAAVYSGPRSQDANFAGEYTLTTWDCGTSCTGGVAVSVTTGREIALPGFVSGWQGKGSDVIFRKDSRLIVLAGLIDEGGQYGVHFYELVDDRFEHIQTTPAGE